MSCFTKSQKRKAKLNSKIITIKKYGEKVTETITEHNI